MSYRYYSGFQMTAVSKSIKNVAAIHKLPLHFSLHFLYHTQLKIATALCADLKPRENFEAPLSKFSLPHWVSELSLCKQYLRGRVTTNSVPIFNSLSTDILPLQRLTQFLTIDNPNPVPGNIPTFLPR